MAEKRIQEPFSCQNHISDDLFLIPRQITGNRKDAFGGSGVHVIVKILSWIFGCSGCDYILAVIPQFQQ